VRLKSQKEVVGNRKGIMATIYASCGHEITFEEMIPCWYMSSGREGRELSWGILCPKCKTMLAKDIADGNRLAEERGMTDE